MTSLRLVILSATLLPSLWAEPDTASSLDKRFSINMMDPLTRRSALDKNFVRFGRSGGGINVNREGRGRPDSFVRFGRGEEDEDDPEEMISTRDSRGKTDFIRFGRGGNNGGSGFIRFGRGKNDNFVRFGRARQDSFVRFGKGFNDYLNPMEDSMNFDRMSRGGNNGYNTNFVRFGKRDPETNEEVINAYKNGLNFDLDTLRKENLARIARFSGKNKQDSFIRFGREPSLYYEDLPKKYSPILKEYGDLDINRNPDSEADVESPKSSSRTSESSDGYSSYDSTLHGDTRKKRSLSFNDLNTNPSLTTNIPDLSSFYNYPSPLAAAGLPNFIIGPELSVLPTQAKLHNSGKKIEDKNFIRLG